MGSSLRRQLREVLPPEIKGLQRAIALEIADDARYDDGWRYDPENGRCSKARLADLVRWTGAKDELSVREMLRRMAVAGWEFRVPIGKGKDGRPLYAVPGRAMQFRVPDFQGPTVVGPYGGIGPEGPTVVAEGPTTVGEGPTVVAEGPTTVGSPSQVLPFTSHQDPTTTSPAEPPADVPPPTPEATNGGGGGNSLRETAIHIAASLDYQGKPPTRKQRQTIEDRLVVFLDAGWTMEDLVIHLDLTGQVIRYAPAVYIDRLDPVELSGRRPSLAAPAPSRGGALGRVATAEEIRAVTLDSLFSDGQSAGPALSWAEAQANARQRVGVGAGGGTDGNVAGWMNLSRDFAAKEPHKPYSDDTWRRPATPEEAARYPWCGDLECHEATRMRDGMGDDGLPNVAQCHKCHPNYQPF